MNRYSTISKVLTVLKWRMITRWGLVKIEGTFYNRTTIPEFSEDRTTSVPSVVKTSSHMEQYPRTGIN